LNLKKRVILFSISLAFCQSMVSASTALEEACSLYDKHDYGASLKKLDSLPNANRNAKSEYYRGLNLQALQRFPEAKESFQKVAAQKKDARLALLARQGLLGLGRAQKRKMTARLPGAASAAGPEEKAKPQSQFVTDSKWKVAKPGEGGEGTDFHGLPSGWTFVKTREGCGRH
jgi:hypothetical protein